MKSPCERIVLTTIPSCSGSVRTNWSTETLANMLWRIGRLVERGRHIVVSRSGYENNEIRTLSETKCLKRTTFVSAAQDKFWEILTGNFGDVGLHEAPLIYAPLGASLLPMGVGDVLARYHAAKSLDCTILRGLPVEATIVAYNRMVARKALTRRPWRSSGPHKASETWAEKLADAAASRREGRGLAEIDGNKLLGLANTQIPTSIELQSLAGARRFERICKTNGDWLSLRSAGCGDDTTEYKCNQLSKSTSLLEMWRQELAKDLGKPWAPGDKKPEIGNRERVLFVSNPVAYSGAEEALCRAIARMPKSRFELYALLGAEGVFAERLRALGVTTTIAEVRMCDSSLQTFSWLSNFYREVAPAIVHFNAFSGDAPVVVAKWFASACVYHLRVNILPPKQLECLLQMDSVVAVSRRTHRLAVDLGVERQRIATVYDPIDTAIFAPIDEEQRRQAKVHAGLTPHKTAILMVARLERGKRHDLLLKAFAKVANTNVQLVLVGESNGDIQYEQEIENLIRTRNLSGQVILKGFQNDIRSIESAADIAVLCSDDEPLGMFALECMALGVPVILSENSGAAEIMGDDGVAGLIQRKGDDEHLAELLSWMMLHPAERQKMGRIGRERCDERCGGGNTGLNSLFNQLVERRHFGASRRS